MADVFISYASGDREAIKPIAEALGVLGLDVWFDQKLHVGKHWDEEIERELERALAVIVCWSPRSVTSGWVIHEATFAQQKGNLAPVYIRECTAPGPHSRVQGIKLFGWKGESENDSWHQLLDRLEALLNRDDLIRKAKERAGLTSSPLAEAQKKQREIGQHLPYLRRFARAATGGQATGDGYVASVAETLFANPEYFQDSLPGRVLLYRALARIFPGSKSIISPHRLAFLLVALEDFSEIEAAQILDVPAERFRELMGEAHKEIMGQVPRNILIIEDEPLIALDLMSIVTEMGHLVLQATKEYWHARTRDEAVAAADKQHLDLILSDVQLADGSTGIDAVNEILSKKSVPVIFVTSYPERLLTGARTEPTYLIPKPFRVDTVRAVVAQALFLAQGPGLASQTQQRSTAESEEDKSGKPRRLGVLGRWFGSKR